MTNEVLHVVKEVPLCCGWSLCSGPIAEDGFLPEAIGVHLFPRVWRLRRLQKLNAMGLLTTPYAFNQDEAISMAKAGADIIVAHMGFTTSGHIGAKTVVSIEESVMIGPISGPKEAEYVLKITNGVH